MTNLPEAKLAREAEICYATLALSTDYDCWHETEEDVTVEAVVAIMKKNVSLAKAIVEGQRSSASPRRAPARCTAAAAHAVMTAPEAIPAARRASGSASSWTNTGASRNDASGLVVVGSVALDSVEANGTVHDDVLGGSASFFSTAASYFAPVQLVAVVGEDLPEQHLEFLGARGVDLDGARARARARPSAGRGATRTISASRTTLDTQLNVFADFKPQLPEAWRDARVPVPRQHPPGAAARRADAGAASRASWRWTR